ncbi:MAG TPA: L-type lectin-domain containing protein [Saprospiraceae bacterium]
MKLQVLNFLSAFKPAGMTLVIIMVVCMAGQLDGQKYLFQINDFKASDANINLLGGCSIAEGKLRLVSDKANQAGACWYKARKIDFTDGFETEFTFLISKDAAGALPGDGFAFVIQAQSPELSGGTGDAIGYKKIPYAVALEFDIKDDNEGSRNHISLAFYNAETKNYRQYATVYEIPEITDGKPHFTRIIYREGRLQVFLDSYLFPVLSVKLDVAVKINSPDHTGWLGFTASTSDLHANHDLISWSIKEFSPQPEDIAVDSVVVIEKGTLQVKKRKMTISVWDHNTVDGDIISLKLGDEWILTEYELTSKKNTFDATLLGFSQDLVLYAHNVGMVPPNTVTISIFDGLTTQRVSLESNMETSEAIKIAFTGEEESE